jgi:hypothetical protein
MNLPECASLGLLARPQVLQKRITTKLIHPQIKAFSFAFHQ